MYVQKHKSSREHKFDETSYRCIFIRHDEYNGMQYYMFDVSKNRVSKVCDVRFDDNKNEEMKRMIKEKARYDEIDDNKREVVGLEVKITSIWIV